MASSHALGDPSFLLTFYLFTLLANGYTQCFPQYIQQWLAALLIDYRHYCNQLCRVKEEKINYIAFCFIEKHIIIVI